MVQSGLSSMYRVAGAMRGGGTLLDVSGQARWEGNSSSAEVAADA